MFGYVSVAQLSQDIRAGIWQIPDDVDLIVGIPRSGMLPAYLIGLYVNRLVADLEAFLANERLGHGQTRVVGVALERPQDAKHVLLVDDSVATGASIENARSRVAAAGFSGSLTTCAAIVSPEQKGQVDIFFREMPRPRLFEWNALHHSTIATSCVDLDGVLCVDPSEEDNDDGIRYLEFIRTATPLFRPTHTIGHIVSARLERYRLATEEWLKKSKIEYGQLHLLDLPNKEERKRLRAHVSHKAAVYRSTGSRMFYESDAAQAKEISQLAAKPVLCISDMTMYLPGHMSTEAVVSKIKWKLKIPYGHLRGWLRRRSRSV
jgi:uncharacterized HAD superfamily protein/adenine/guanine phosphoribosyltransferase-like PRPP-binding protein